MATTPLRHIRVDDELWEAFGAAVGRFGLDRSKVLVRCMKDFVRAAAPETYERLMEQSVSRSADTDQG